MRSSVHMALALMAMSSPQPIALDVMEQRRRESLPPVLPRGTESGNITGDNLLRMRAKNARKKRRR